MSHRVKPDTAQDFRRSVPGIAAAFVAVTCLGFAAFTRHAWEDYYITFRCSLNLATGQGLVYQPGEHVHAFTSPLGTLLPALLALGGGTDVAGRALWLFRLLGSAALAVGVAITARRLLREGAVPAAVAAGCGLWIFDAKTVDFTINGMEVALVVFFLVLCWQAFVDEAPAWRIGLALAGLQWTRPDGWVYFGALALAWLALGPAPRRPRFALLLRGALIGLVLTLPWLAVATLYYGSPIPHTIVAKVQLQGPAEVAAALATYPVRLLFGRVALHDLFLPAYFYFGGWPAWLPWFGRLVSVAAALAWMWPMVRRPARLASAAFFLGGFYVEYIPRSPWYYPGWQALACIAWIGLVDALLRLGARPGRWNSFGARLGRIAILALVAIQLALLAGVAWEMHTQQRVIETQHRAVIGKWLKAHARPGDRVYLEPLGYIGYFSGLKMLDYPGLASPEVVAARRAGNRTQAEIIAALRPEWLVLRPDQVAGVLQQSPSLLAKDYVLARSFDANAAVQSVAFLPGRGYLQFDAHYDVFARRDRPGEPAHAAHP